MGILKEWDDYVLQLGLFRTISYLNEKNNFSTITLGNFSKIPVEEELYCSHNSPKAMGIVNKCYVPSQTAKTL